MKTQVFVRGRCIGKRATPYGDKLAGGFTDQQQKTITIEQPLSDAATAGPLRRIEETVLLAALAAITGSAYQHPDALAAAVVEVVRHEVAAVHVLLGLLADFGPFLDGGAQDVARCVVREPEVLLETLALCPLPGPGRSEQNQVQLRQSRHPAARVTSGSPRNSSSSAGLPAA